MGEISCHVLLKGLLWPGALPPLLCHGAVLGGGHATTQTTACLPLLPARILPLSATRPFLTSSTRRGRWVLAPMGMPACISSSVAGPCSNRYAMTSCCRGVTCGTIESAAARLVSLPLT